MKLILDLDEVFGDVEYPQTKYDIGGMGHYIIIDSKNKQKVIDKMVSDYRELLEFEFKETEDEE